MKYIVACLMAFGFYGLTFGQSDTASRIPDTTGMGNGELSCYMVDEATYLCTLDEATEEEWNQGEGADPGEQEDIMKEEDALHEEEGVLDESKDIEGREEDVTGEPSTRENEFPAEPERESDEGVFPQPQGESDNPEQTEKSEDTLNTY